MNKLSPRFILCTGFHRSGTSLIAQAMQSAGVHLGNSLMGASFGNRLGHFEELSVVELHDKILRLNNTDWRFRGNKTLLKPNWLGESINKYVANSLSLNNIAGVKDPRAVYFLDDWLNAGDESIVFILVYRHWLSSANSLHKRHSRELLNFNVAAAARSVDYDFWSTPELAFDMWAANSKAMIEFYQKHPNRCLLVSQERFTKEPEFVISQAEKLNVGSTFLNTNAIHKDLISNDVPSSCRALIDTVKQNEMDVIWNTLESIADCPALTLPAEQNEKGNIGLIPITKSKVTKQSANKQDLLVTSNKNMHGVNLEGLTWQQIFDCLDEFGIETIDQIALEQLLNKPQGTSKDYERIAHIAKSKGVVWLSELFLLRAIYQKPYPWQYMHLGDLYRSQGMWDSAKLFFQKAFDWKPENPNFALRLADVAVHEQDYEKAADFLAKGSGGSAKYIAHVERCLKNIAPNNKHIIASEKEFTLPIIKGYDHVVEVMTNNYNNGLGMDKYLQKTVFMQRDNWHWLMDASQALTNNAQSSFIHHIQKHWANLWHKDILATELAYDETCFDRAYEFDCRAERVESSLSLAVCIHVYHVNLLREILCFVDNIPYKYDLIVSCMEETVESINQVLSEFRHGAVKVVSVGNRGRDIAPWLMHKELHQKYDLVCKLHTKSSPHEPELRGWRLQLLFSLLASPEYIESLVKAFEDDPTLGVAMPPYHPRILNDIGWGLNQSLATELCTKLGLSMPVTMDVFPAGSMFWYRPAALKGLLNKDWKIDDFPEEAGQSDGTIIHAMERLILTLANHNGFQSRFVHHLDAWHKTGYHNII
jgi:tetratricopeptide (TPR) repeat protein